MWARIPFYLDKDKKIIRNESKTIVDGIHVEGYK